MKKLILYVGLFCCLEGFAAAAPEVIDALTNQALRREFARRLRTPLDNEGEAKLKHAKFLTNQYKNQVFVIENSWLDAVKIAMWGPRYGKASRIDNMPFVRTVLTLHQCGLNKYCDYVQNMMAHEQMIRKVTVLAYAVRRLDMQNSPTRLNAEELDALFWVLDEGGERGVISMQRRLFGNGNNDVEANPPA
jgi:hypothetical protein